MVLIKKNILESQNQSVLKDNKGNILSAKFLNTILAMEF